MVLENHIHYSLCNADEMLQMQKEQYSLIQLSAEDTIPYELLLLADETREAIDKYIGDSMVFVLQSTTSNDAGAAFALYPINAEELELKNIAVAENLQGAGIGSYLITEIKKIAKDAGYNTLWVGTPDTAVRELNFYKKNGFEDAYIKENFFLENYTEPIYNNGVLLKDMAMLKTIL